MRLLRCAGPIRGPGLQGACTGGDGRAHRLRPGRLRACLLVTPGTLVRWHYRPGHPQAHPPEPDGTAASQRRDRSAHRAARRPRTTALDTTGLKASCSSRPPGQRVHSLRRVLKVLKIPPAPQRRTDTTWRKFLRAQKLRRCSLPISSTSTALAIRLNVRVGQRDDRAAAVPVLASAPGLAAAWRDPRALGGGAVMGAARAEAVLRPPARSCTNRGVICTCTCDASSSFSARTSFSTESASRL